MKVNRCMRAILKVNVAGYIVVSLLLFWLFTVFMPGEPPDIGPGIPLETAFDTIFSDVLNVRASYKTGSP
jgi:hypothetical protein